MLCEWCDVVAESGKWAFVANKRSMTQNSVDDTVVTTDLDKAYQANLPHTTCDNHQMRS